MARVRSPSFPFVGLEKAIDRAREFYDSERMSRVNISVALQKWSYNEKSSAGKQTLAALVAFGLMDNEGRKERRSVALTEVAKVILVGSRDSSRQEKIRECALKPNIHKTLWEYFDGKFPSDHTLRDYLLLQHEPPFNDNSVDQFISQFRATLEFARLTKIENVSDEYRDINSVSPSSEEVSERNEEDKESNGLRDESAAESLPEPKTLPSVPLAGGTSETLSETLRLRLSQGSRAEVRLSGSITGKSIEKLIDFLNLQKDTYPEG